MNLRGSISLVFVAALVCCSADDTQDIPAAGADAWAPTDGASGADAPASPADASPSTKTADASSAQLEASTPPDAPAGGDSTLGDSGWSDAQGAAPDDAGADMSSDTTDEFLLDGAASEGDVGADADDCGVGPQGEPLELRCTGLYSDWPTRTVAATARPYDPGLHLWSDGATKNRWIQIPSGQMIDTSDMDEWQFPDGTKVWKEFIVAGKHIETRLLWKIPGQGWYPTTYLWSADEQSTVELTTGELNADGNGYEVPAQYACKACHLGRRDYVLGFEAVALSSPGATGLPIATLEAEGLITAPPVAPIVIPGTPVESAALAYLHTNCGVSCHNTVSPAYNKGFLMQLLVGKMQSVKATDTYQTGWNVPTVDYPGMAGTKTRIAACNPPESAVYYRMDRRDGVGDAGPQTQMPPNDTHKVDEAGVATVGAWIDEGCADGGDARDAGADGHR